MEHPRGAVESVVRHYSAVAESYERYWFPALRPMGCVLLDAMPLAAARAVLDLGTGVGGFIGEIRARAPGAFVAGADRTEGMLRVARRRHDVPLAVMDAQRLGFRAGSFDAAVMMFMIEHVPDQVAALRGVHGLLRPGGTLGVAAWANDVTYGAMDVWEGELDAHGAGPDPEPPYDDLERAGSPDRLTALLVRAGLSEVRAWQEKFSYRWEPEQFRAYLGYGGRRRRIETLSPDAQRSCLTRVEERLATLDAEAFTFHPEIVFGVALKVAR